MIYETNIHDYLDNIGAEPPPVEGIVIIPVVNSIEEAVELITKEDEILSATDSRNRDS